MIFSRIPASSPSSVIDRGESRIPLRLVTTTSKAHQSFIHSRTLKNNQASSRWPPLTFLSPLINDPTREPTVHIDKAFAPVTFIDVSGDGNAPLVVHKRTRASGSELCHSCTFGVIDDVSVNALPSYPWRMPGHSVRLNK